MGAGTSVPHHNHAKSRFTETLPEAKIFKTKLTHNLTAPAIKAEKHKQRIKYAKEITIRNYCISPQDHPRHFQPRGGIKWGCLTILLMVSTSGKKKTIKDIADQYPDPPKEKVIETTCPHCGKKLRMKIKI